MKSAPQPGQVQPRDLVNLAPHAMRQPSPASREARNLRRRKWLELRSAVDGLVALGLSKQEKERFAALLERAVRAPRQTSKALSRASSPAERSRSPSG